jgi:hypothetical protein
MAEIIARCGYKCNLCLIYRENLEKDERNRQKFRNGVDKYYGDKLTLEECYCDGCMTDDSENPVLVTKECEVRPCVIARNIDNCAHCVQYPCQTIKKKFVERREVEKRYGSPIPEEPYRLFVMPYENKRTLDTIRRKATRKSEG